MKQFINLSLLVQTINIKLFAFCNSSTVNEISERIYNPLQIPTDSVVHDDEGQHKISNKNNHTHKPVGNG